MNIPATFRQTGFPDLLCDALYQLRLARLSDDSFIQNRHARSSILASVFVVECCANCLLDTLKGSVDYKFDLEKLPAISKYEAYVHATRPEMNFNLGRVEIQKIKELIGLRNEFVHPKINHIDAEMGAFKDASEVVEWPVSLYPKMKSATQLPINAAFWSAANAADAMHAVLTFLNYYLMELLKFTSDEITAMITSRIECEIGDKHVVIESLFNEYDSEFKTAVSAGFDLAFLGYVK